MNSDLLPIQSLEVQVNRDSSVPHVILNGIDFTKENIGLVSLQIDWGTIGTDTRERVVQVSYVSGETGQITVVRQSFPNLTVIE